MTISLVSPTVIFSTANEYRTSSSSILSNVCKREREREGEGEREGEVKYGNCQTTNYTSINSFQDTIYTLYLSFQIYKLSLIANMYIYDIFKMLSKNKFYTLDRYRYRYIILQCYVSPKADFYLQLFKKLFKTVTSAK